MGFRSTFTTEDYGTHWPDWFVEKWKGSVHFGENNRGPISAKHEGKVYSGFQPLCSDIQKALVWDAEHADKFVLVYLHECGGITRVQIEKDRILWSEPTGWDNAEGGVRHSYCSGCSDHPKT